jgi:predicted RNase H-like HicB family nuclease
MLTSNERKDYILRMIAELRRLVEELLGKVRDGDSGEELLARARESIGKLLGPMGGIAPRMDSVTAAQMVGDADVLAAWAEVTAADARVQRAGGDQSSANATARRALELALEAHVRSPHDIPELLALVARLRGEVNPGALLPRHAEILAQVPASSS